MLKILRESAQRVARGEVQDLCIASMETDGIVRSSECSSSTYRLASVLRTVEFNLLFTKSE